LFEFVSFYLKPLEWTLEFDEKLIKCAMDYPCIYDVKIPEYRNAEVKATAFLKIAKGIGCGE
jgi:hypothetical protein